MGIAAKSPIEIFQRFQSKPLKMISNGHVINQYTNASFVEKEIRLIVTKYYNRILQHPNFLANNLMQPSSRFSRLRRKVPPELLS